MRCQLDCSYCIVNKTTGKRPVYIEVGHEKWIKLLKKRKPRLVTFSGGEPFIYPGLDKIVNYLISKGVFVTISTNLLSLNGLLIRPSRFLWLYVTYHKTNKNLFKKNLEIYRLHGYNISVCEFLEKTIEGSVLKELRTEQTTEKIEVYAPDMQKFDSWIELELNG